jgi:nucleotide-binding universal stress UspA family protein
MEIKTILCPLGFSKSPQREFSLSIQLCRAFRAKLVLLYNLDALLPSSLAMNWMYAETHVREEEKEESQAVKLLQEMLASVPASISSEAKITHGPQDFAVLSLARAIEAGLIVVGTPEAVHPERNSVLERILVQSPCSVLTTREPQPGKAEIEFNPDRTQLECMVVPVDLTPHSLRILDYALGLARSLPITLHLLHLEKGHSWRDLHLPAFRMQEQREQRIGEWRDRLVEMIPADLKAKVKVQMRAGGVVDGILRSVEENHSSLILIGIHSASLVEKLISTPAFSEIFRKSPCSVWFVPLPVQRETAWTVEQANAAGI